MTTNVNPTPTVAHVVGRRKGLARRIAMLSADIQGHAWRDLETSEQARLVRCADTIVGKWIEDGDLADFWLVHITKEVGS